MVFGDGGWFVYVVEVVVVVCLFCCVFVVFVLQLRIFFFVLVRLATGGCGVMKLDVMKLDVSRSARCAARFVHVLHQVLQVLAFVGTL